MVNGAGTTGFPYERKGTLTTTSHLYKNSKWTIGLNVKVETMKCLEETQEKIFKLL